jgi:hypothetical protein
MRVVSNHGGKLLTRRHPRDALAALGLVRMRVVQRRRQRWHGSLNNEGSLCVSRHTSPIKSIHDVLERELIIGGAGANDTERFPHALNNLIGTKFKIISAMSAPISISRWSAAKWMGVAAGHGRR